jgi:hypothetical protein
VLPDASDEDVGVADRDDLIWYEQAPPADDGGAFVFM